MAILQQRSNWEPPQTENLSLVISEDYTFIADIGIQDNSLEKTTLIRSTLPPGSYKRYLGTSPPTPLPPRSLSLHRKQINKAKNMLDGQPSSLLASIHVSNYKVFLELDVDQLHLDFKILDENNKDVILRIFYL